MKAKTQRIRDKDIEDLKHELAEKQKHLFDLRSQAVTEKLEDPSQLGKTRRTSRGSRRSSAQRRLEAKSRSSRSK